MHWAPEMYHTGLHSRYNAMRKTDKKNLPSSSLSSAKQDYKQWLNKIHNMLHAKHK